MTYFVKNQNSAKPCYHYNSTALDYYAFGSTLPGRADNTGEYRFGFNGMEGDEDISPLGYTTEYRIYDARISRWFSIDPKFKKFAGQSPYDNNFNNPIVFNDPKGDCPWCPLLLLSEESAVVIDLFLAGVLTSVAIQTTANYAIYGDVEKAFGKVDVFDAVVDGGINVITGGASGYFSLFKNGSSVLIERGVVIVSLQLLSASTDYQYEDSKYKSIFNGDKKLFDFTRDFIFSLAAEYSADEIKSVLKNWSGKDLSPSYFAPLTKEEKELTLKLDKLIRSKTFQDAVEGTTSFATTGANTVIDANGKQQSFVDEILLAPINMKIKTIKVESKSAGKDNTTVTPSPSEFKLKHNDE